MSDAFDRLLTELTRTHAGSAALRDFCPLPVSPNRIDVPAYHIPAADLMTADQNLTTTDHTALRDAFIAAAPLANWRETYRDTAIGADFRERFGCYCVIGQQGPFVSHEMSAYVVYMPAGLHYPWHHHPAEELYFILAGQAEFHLEGTPSNTLGPGDHVFHPSNRPHATDTHDHPFMALVLWRNELGTTPVLTYPERLS